MKKSHGLAHTRLYRIYHNMKNRCCNPNVPCYKHYGGRGINVCKEWTNSFVAFYEWSVANGYDDSLTIDRIDVNRDYCPQNCRWVSRSVQSRNKRFNLAFDGKLLCDIATNEKEYRFLRDRLKAGIPFDRPKRAPTRPITVCGTTHSLREWARILNINSGKLHYWLEQRGVGYIKERLENT